MKRIAFIVIAVFCLLLLCGCKSRKQASQLPPPPPITLNHQDSVTIEKTIETTLTTVDVSVPIPSQSESNKTTDDSSHVETDLAFSDAWLENGILHHTISNKPGEMKWSVPVPQTTQTIEKSKTTLNEVPVPQPYPFEVERNFTLSERIKIASFWYLFCATILGVFFIILKVK